METSWTVENWQAFRQFVTSEADRYPRVNLGWLNSRLTWEASEQVAAIVARVAGGKLRRPEEWTTRDAVAVEWLAGVNWSRIRLSDRTLFKRIDREADRQERRQAEARDPGQGSARGTTDRAGKVPGSDAWRDDVRAVQDRAQSMVDNASRRTVIVDDEGAGR